MKRIIVVFAMAFAVGLISAQNNDKNVKLSKNDNETSINQVELNNVDQVNQINKRNSYTGFQKGNNNYSRLEQGSASKGENVAGVNQSGKENYLNKYDENGGSIKSSAVQSEGNNLQIKQTGNHNIAGLLQDFHTTTAIIQQTGDFNTTEVTQHDYLDYAEMKLTGDKNYAKVVQTDGLKGQLNKAYGWVKGKNNGYHSKGNFWLEIIQKGSYNWAQYSIEGNSNDVDISQTGTYHFAYVGITGNENDVNINQTTSKNESSSTIRGDDNTISITQTGNKNSNCNLLNGDLNVVTVHQTGNCNTNRNWVGKESSSCCGSCCGSSGDNDGN